MAAPWFDATSRREWGAKPGFDIFAVKGSTGDLFVYRSRDGVFLYPYPKVGNGWQGVDLWPAGAVRRNGLSDVYGIDSSGGLYWCRGLPGGGFATKVRVGYGWLGFDIASGADLDGDNQNDLIGRDSQGRVFFYRGLPDGRFATKVLVADGWLPSAVTGPDCSVRGPGKLVALPWEMPSMVAYAAVEGDGV
ncbi:MAG: hypothetical protein LBJ62_09540 [Bifidobacteriaceae bacterium]|nr:hypothetical protein [Bifidobacteriaceae bacterium]